MHMPPLNLSDCAEKEPSFHKLVPPLNSMYLACFKHVAAGSLISYKRRISVDGVVNLKMFLKSLRFLRPATTREM